MIRSPEISWLANPAAALNESARAAARRRQGQLTKPPGSLGKLETLAEQFAAWQGRELPAIERVGIRIFAADHGIAARGVSAFPQAVTGQMILNFCAGGAAISVLGKLLDADFGVINLGCVAPVPDHPLLQQHSLGPGTADFTQGAAMTHDQLAAALNTGRQAVNEPSWALFVGGEMGIGNTTAAAALAAALLDIPPEYLVGPGTGVKGDALVQKLERVKDALDLHARPGTDPLTLLGCLGGFEIAALVGAYIACAQQATPAIVDGFISSVAALVACHLHPGTRDWLLFGHKSTEPGHTLVLETLKAEPLLDLNMRLGEGSGAALTVNLVQQALALHRGMATFAEAGVSDA